MGLSLGKKGVQWVDIKPLFHLQDQSKLDQPRGTRKWTYEGLFVVAGSPQDGRKIDPCHEA